MRLGSAVYIFCSFFRFNWRRRIIRFTMMIHAAYLNTFTEHMFFGQDIAAVGHPDTITSMYAQNKALFELRATYGCCLAASWISGYDHNSWEPTSSYPNHLLSFLSHFRNSEKKSHRSRVSLKENDNVCFFFI